jgi:hypothetical protein
MSFLASLPAKLHGKAGKTALYVVGGLLLAVVGWWLLAPSGHPEAGPAAGRPSALRRIAQRVTNAPPTPKLQISDVQQNGQIVEIRGTADCDAAVMINGERVPLIFDHCGFKHFVLLPQGPSTIAITAQGSAGGVNTQLIKVNIQ